MSDGDDAAHVAPPGRQPGAEAAAGYYGSATPGYHNPAAPGYHNPAAAGYHNPAAAGYYGAAAGGYPHPSPEQYYNAAAGGYNSAAAAGYNNSGAAGYNNSAAAGYNNTATGGYYNPAAGTGAGTGGGTPKEYYYSDGGCGGWTGSTGSAGEEPAAAPARAAGRAAAARAAAAGRGDDDDDEASRSSGRQGSSKRRMALEEKKRAQQARRQQVLDDAEAREADRRARIAATRADRQRHEGVQDTRERDEARRQWEWQRDDDEIRRLLAAARHPDQQVRPDPVALMLGTPTPRNAATGRFVLDATQHRRLEEKRAFLLDILARKRKELGKAKALQDRLLGDPRLRPPCDDLPPMEDDETPVAAANDPAAATTANDSAAATAENDSAAATANGEENGAVAVQQQQQQQPPILKKPKRLAVGGLLTGSVLRVRTFLYIYCETLKLHPFGADELAQALRWEGGPTVLLAEVHCALMALLLRESGRGKALWVGSVKEGRVTSGGGGGDMVALARAAAAAAGETAAADGGIAGSGDGGGAAPAAKRQRAGGGGGGSGGSAEEEEEDRRRRELAALAPPLPSECTPSDLLSPLTWQAVAYFILPGLSAYKTRLAAATEAIARGGSLAKAMTARTAALQELRNGLGRQEHHLLPLPLKVLLLEILVEAGFATRKIISLLQENGTRLTTLETQRREELQAIAKQEREEHAARKVRAREIARTQLLEDMERRKQAAVAAAAAGGGRGGAGAGGKGGRGGRGSGPMRYGGRWGNQLVACTEEEAAAAALQAEEASENGGGGAGGDDTASAAASATSDAAGGGGGGGRDTPAPAATGSEAGDGDAFSETASVAAPAKPATRPRKGKGKGAARQAGPEPTGAAVNAVVAELFARDAVFGWGSEPFRLHDPTEGDDAEGGDADGAESGEEAVASDDDDEAALATMSRQEVLQRRKAREAQQRAATQRRRERRKRESLREARAAAVEQLEAALASKDGDSLAMAIDAGRMAELEGMDEGGRWVHPLLRNACVMALKLREAHLVALVEWRFSRELAERSMRNEPLGRDRYGRYYWKFPNDDRIYVEEVVRRTDVPEPKGFLPRLRLDELVEGGSSDLPGESIGARKRRRADLDETDPVAGWNPDRFDPDDFAPEMFCSSWFYLQEPQDLEGLKALLSTGSGTKADLALMNAVQERLETAEAERQAVAAEAAAAAASKMDVVAEDGAAAASTDVVSGDGAAATAAAAASNGSKKAAEASVAAAGSDNEEDDGGYKAAAAAAAAALMQVKKEGAEWCEKDSDLIGRRVRRPFGDYGFAAGTVTGWISAEDNDGVALWHVILDGEASGREEQLEESVVRAAAALWDRTRPSSSDSSSGGVNGGGDSAKPRNAVLLYLNEAIRGVAPMREGELGAEGLRSLLLAQEAAMLPALRTGLSGYCSAAATASTPAADTAAAAVKQEDPSADPAESAENAPSAPVSAELPAAPVSRAEWLKLLRSAPSIEELRTALLQLEESARALQKGEDKVEDGKMAMEAKGWQFSGGSHEAIGRRVRRFFAAAPAAPNAASPDAATATADNDAAAAAADEGGAAADALRMVASDAVVVAFLPGGGSDGGGGGIGGNRWHVVHDDGEEEELGERELERGFAYLASGAVEPDEDDEDPAVGAGNGGGNDEPAAAPPGGDGAASDEDGEEAITPPRKPHAAVPKGSGSPHRKTLWRSWGARQRWIAAVRAAETAPLLGLGLVMLGENAFAMGIHLASVLLDNRRRARQMAAAKQGIGRKQGGGKLRGAAAAAVAAAALAAAAAGGGAGDAGEEVATGAAAGNGGPKAKGKGKGKRKRTQR